MKKVFLLLTVMSLTVFSCDNYLDINEDPNNVAIEKVPPRLILPGAQLNAYRVQNGTMNELGNVFMNSWAGNVNSFTGGYNSEFRLLVNSSFYDGIWDGIYSATNNFQQIIDYPSNGEQDNYVAISKILKAHYLAYIIDLYGDAPYEEAFLGQENLTPKYTDDVVMFKSLITELEEARTLIDNPSINAEPIASEDIMMNGNMAEWKKFANTVQLRMLLRLKNTTDASLITYRDTKLGDLASASFSNTDVKINPGFSAANNSSVNPFLLNLVDAAGARTQDNRFICASGHMAKFLNGDNGSDEIITGSGRNYPNTEDYRGRVMWRRKGGKVAGVAQGATSGSPDAANPASEIGFQTFSPYAEVPFPSPLSSYSQFTAFASVSGYVMTASQAAFLLAEAKLEHPTIFSTINAQAKFNEGISKSFDFYDFSAATSTYMSNISGVVGLDWTGTDNEKLEAIMTQKWIASTHVNAMESFIDYNKTGFPLTPLASTTNKSNKPYRLVYPISEYVSNSANVPNITDNDIFTINSKSPFWLQ